MAKVFWTGRSQAVRLPKAYRFDGKEVRIRRDGDKVILEPALENDEAWVKRFAGTFDEDFARSIEEGRYRPEDAPEPLSFD